MTTLREKVVPPDIEVHIERLVVHGIDVRNRDQLGPAIESELHRLFTENGWPDPPVETIEAGRVNGGAFRTPSVTHADSAGARIAGAIYGGLTA